MKRRSLAALALLLLGAGCGRQQESADLKAQDFALSLKVEASGAQVLRIDLPAAALVAIRRPDKGDIRVVDAHDRPLSMAFIAAGAARQSEVHLDAMPFGAPDGDERPAPVSVRVDRDGSSVNIQSGTSETGAPGHGVVFDTRNVRETATGLSLEAIVPKQKPVRISIATGKDLKSWEPLAERVLFRPGDGPELLGGNRIALPPVALQGHYMHVVWQGEPELSISGATLFTSITPPRPRISIPASGLTLTDTHMLDFSMPPGAMPAAMRVTMTGNDGVVPLRLLGRDTAETPWTPLAMASLRQGATGALLEIGERPLRLIRLEADPRSAGFSQAPKVELHYAPITLAVAFNGAGPYRLLVGNGEAKPATFALSDLTNATGPLAEARVIGAKPDVAVELGGGGHASMPSPRLIALWLALLAGVALLAYAAFRLMRSNSAA